MQFDIDNVKGPVTNVEDQSLVGHYSVDGEKRYRADLSQLKYYKAAKNPKNVHFDLEKTSDLTVPKVVEEFPLEYLLKWTMLNFDRIKTQNPEAFAKRWLQPEIICFRGHLTTLLTTPYDRENGWIISASKLGGTIYLCSFDTDEKKRRIQAETEYQKKCSRWGYKCEQYLVSDTPSTDPDPSTPVNQNEEFCCIFKSKIGKTVLLYGAEMDGVCSTAPIEDTLVGKNVEFIEIKTINNKFVRYDGQVHRSKSLNLLKWWCQSYLVGIQKIICCCRNPMGIVRRIMEFKLSDLPANSESDWSTETCKSFCNAFLELIKEVVQEECGKCIYVFKLDPGMRHIQMHQESPKTSQYVALPQWYIEEATKRGKRI